MANRSFLLFLPGNAVQLGQLLTGGGLFIPLRLIQASPALFGGSLLWSAGFRFFCGLFLLLHFRQRVAHRLHNGVELSTVINVGNDVQDAGFLVLMLGGCVQDAELFGDLLELLIVCGLDRDDNGFGVGYRPCRPPCSAA